MWWLSRLALLALYFVGVLTPLFIALQYNSSQGVSITYQMGKGFALVGIMILAFQIILAGRFKWVDRPFGLDHVLRFHKYIAIFATLLILCHPVLLVIGGAGLGLVTDLDIPWYIWVGKGALALLLVNIVLSLYRSKLKIKFEIWRALHDVIGVAIILLAFVHSGFAGSDINQSAILKSLWVAIPIVWTILFIYHLFIRPKMLSRHPYRVIEVKKETSDVYSLKFAPAEGQKVFDYFPGQFQFITLHRENLPVEEHHWTISSSPLEKDFVTSTIKELGDFTKTIVQTKPGDTAILHGAFGHFSYLLYPEEKDLVFITGGIGITPLMSMLRHMRDIKSSLPVLLIYANDSEIVFHDELLEMEKGRYPRLKVIHVLSKPNDVWQGERGHLDREKIERFLGSELAEKSFYVSGPSGLVNSIKEYLHQMKIPKNKIHMEFFSFVD